MLQYYKMGCWNLAIYVYSNYHSAATVEMTAIFKQTGTTQSSTTHCLRNTIVVQQPLGAGLQAREVMSVSGHKGESSLQKYRWPKVSREGGAALSPHQAMHLLTKWIGLTFLQTLCNITLVTLDSFSMGVQLIRIFKWMWINNLLDL